MTSAEPVGLRRDPKSSSRATLLELFFDVFYVAAFAQLSMELAEHSTWSGLGQGLVLLLAVWWTWSVTAIVTEFYDPRLRVIQGVVASAMFGVALMAVAVPSAYEGRGLLFASAYVGLHLVRGALLVGALRPRRAHAREERFLFWFVISGVLWLAGGFVDPAWRVGLWAGALAVDYMATALRHPTPRLGRVPLDQYNQLSVHFGERYQQIAILALGELTLMATLTFASEAHTPARAAVFLIAIATALLFWQIYVLQSNTLVDRSAHWRPRQAVRLAPYVYAGVVTGVIATSAGVELVLHEPLGPTTPTSWVALIVGGPVLFVLGRMSSEYVLLGQLPRSRVGWLVLLLGLTPVLSAQAPIVVLIVTMGVLFGITLTDARRNRHH
ncbi:low temperature requirement protein LtrA [Micromonospora vinacea]|uniref:Low temperature requirement protein LtrA n=1 Tax=Micromonospora vinacea TaxID=709878 RepID=A0ABS0KBL2_9ACTN|nr:low temperature requirement protein A [Micromonospora vinacea]MBG6106023.1 low temperature requirement protein LtrA [Micromonospora vinacea]WTA65735.1 low temperature requirement protein A [Micromonospora sp. NBC_00855]